MDEKGVAEALRPGLVALGPEGESTGGAPPVAIEPGTALFVMDLEMSGPNPRLHEVLEIGGVLARLASGFPEEASWGSRVRPLHIGNAVPGALKVVGYSPKAWREAISLEAAVEKMSALGRGAVVTGWGIRQDLAFLAEVCRRAKRSWPFAAVALDIQPVARVLLKETGRVDYFNLGHVADRLGIGRMGEHSALADAYAAYDVLVKLMELPEGTPSQ
jgi:DNA polymerase-3 subunit epsilon